MPSSQVTCTSRANGLGCTRIIAHSHILLDDVHDVFCGDVESHSHSPAGGCGVAECNPETPKPSRRAENLVHLGGRLPRGRCHQRPVPLGDLKQARVGATRRPSLMTKTSVRNEPTSARRSSSWWPAESSIGLPRRLGRPTSRSSMARSSLSTRDKLCMTFTCVLLNIS